MTEILALKVNDKDNVATIFANDVKAGMVVQIRDKKGNSVSETLLADIPYGHKVAVKPIKRGNRSSNTARKSVWQRRILIPEPMCMYIIWTVREPEAI